MPRETEPSSQVTLPATAWPEPDGHLSGFIGRAGSIAAVTAVALLSFDSADWQPISLVVALTALMIAADVVPVPARLIRLSAGLLIQVVIMALLGPVPAMAIGVVSILIESRVNRVPVRPAFTNALIYAILGLVGGLVFEGLRGRLGLERDDTAYALLVMPVYCALAALNLAMIVVIHRGVEFRVRLRIFRDTGVPTIPLELLSAVMAAAAVLVWAHAGLLAAAALLGTLVITIPLVHAVGDALKKGDDLLALRHVSDQRAAEVARLASDRERLLSELFEAEQRERARLAESLHDGPMQRFVAVYQDAAEQDGKPWNAVTTQLQEAIAETRAIISAFHPATVRELGFEASLRAAVAPFPAARSVDISMTIRVEDSGLARTILLPIAQELVVNAVKHANPHKIRVSVDAIDQHVVLEVSDDGRGIDTEDAGRAVQAGHLGLAMVRRRVEDAGGKLDIETRLDGGTRTLVALPLDLA
jgi:signal transduction histidine kinase